MKLAPKFCKCIKSVRKTIKARKGVGAEQGAIAVCVKSVLQTRGRTMKKFSCGKTPRLVTQSMRGGVHPSPWIVLKNYIVAATAAMKRQPEKKPEYAEELMGKIESLGDLPPVSPETRKYYDAAVEASAEFPDIQEYVRSMEAGSAFLRRSPMLALRTRLRKRTLRK
jgi:hypothetical protein